MLSAGFTGTLTRRSDSGDDPNYIKYIGYGVHTDPTFGMKILFEKKMLTGGERRPGYGDKMIGDMEIQDGAEFTKSGTWRCIAVPAS